MPRTYTICRHSDREAIDRLLVDGGRFRHIAARFNISTGALQRHKAEHLLTALINAGRAEEVARGDTLLDQLRGLQDRALSILGKAEAAGDLRTALGGVREARGCLELLGKLAGELHDGPTVNVLVAPEWVTLRSTILVALEPYPQAKGAVVEALNGHAG